jgi:2-succinyl-5-enolpyruvyl-6-hydroxy-3-cyclohexene-1-carboxylate synthase
MNQAFALELIRELTTAGVREFCVCPGARNSPLSALLLELPELRVLHFFEERAAAFFALGRIKALGHPVAVVTTSGTAAGELLPATMEAHYTSLPLVLLTADRPRRFRGSGAPQTAEQPGIFGVYVEQSLDLSASEQVHLAAWSRKQPLHLNACFEEPLLDRSAEAELQKVHPTFWQELGNAEDIRIKDPLAESSALASCTRIRAGLRSFLETSRHPLAIVSGLQAEDRANVRQFLLAAGIPAYLEAPSGLREDPSLASQRVHISDGILARARRSDYPIDGVLRIGSVPTLRLWRDLEALGDIPVFSLSRAPFSGLSWARLEAAAISRVLSDFSTGPSAGAQLFLTEDRRIQEKLEQLLKRHPRSEPALFRALSETIGARAASRVFIGNSLPIREWDLAASFAPRHESPSMAREIGASRGLNGIDGQVSTFLGHCLSGHENWGILGDLTTLYDLPGPWILPQLDPALRATLVVVNNGGGKIFSRMFPQPEFQNPHSIRFASWAEMWGLPYEHWETVPANGTIPNGHEKSAPLLRIVELTPDRAETDRFWKEADALWR